MPDTDLHDLFTQLSREVDTVDLLPRVRQGVRTRTQRRIATGVLSVAVLVAAVVYGAVQISGRQRSLPPAHHVHHGKLAVPTTTFGPTTRSVTPIMAIDNVGDNGPEYLGIKAFGAIWTSGGGHSPTGGLLYRVSLNGKHALTQSPYDALGINQPGPVRIGRTIAVADGNNDDYTVFSRTGRRLATLPNHSAGALTGDATGGWVATTDNRVSRLDASGRHVMRSFSLPVASIDGLATSPGILWVIDSSRNRLLRVNSDNGSVTGHLRLPATPTQVAYLAGAVYVSATDHDLRRIDPTTMKVTAATHTTSDTSVPWIATGPPGELWAQGQDGTIAQLNPTSLTTEQNIHVFDNEQNQASGAIVTRHRIYLSDNGNDRLYSFRRK